MSWAPSCRCTHTPISFCPSCIHPHLTDAAPQGPPCELPSESISQEPTWVLPTVFLILAVTPFSVCQSLGRVWLFATPWTTRLLCPWNFPGQNTGVGSHSLLQGIFPTQGLNPGLLLGRQILYCWATRETPGSHDITSLWDGNHMWKTVKISDKDGCHLLGFK